MYSTLERSNFVVSDTAAKIQLLRDLTEAPWEDFDVDSLAEHFGNIHALFVSRINGLTDRNQGLSPFEERELQFMFDALVQAKRALLEHGR